MLVADSSNPQLFYVQTSDLSYVYGISISGALTDWWDNNKILMDGNYFHVETIENNTGYIRLYKYSIQDIIPSLAVSHKDPVSNSVANQVTEEEYKAPEQHILLLNGTAVVITVGAADSGGSGFRLLRIPN